MIKRKVYTFKIAMRASIIFLESLFKSDKETKMYIFKKWLHAMNSFLNPFSHSYQSVILYIRSKYLNKKTSNSITDLQTEYLDAQSLFDLLDIIYINLDERSDRNEHMIGEFNRIGLSNSKRFAAAKNKNGILGCAISHYHVVNGWEPKENRLLLICEDDISFIGNKVVLRELLTQFILNDFDIMCLSYNNYNQVSVSDLFYLTSDTQTMSCYVVKPHMKEVLLENYLQSIQMLKLKIDNQFAAIDIVWKSLQRRYNFVTPKNRFSLQIESYSNITNRVENYKV